jgi:hypothetical protein
MISCGVPVCTNHGFREPTFGVHRWVMSTHQEELRTANVKLLSRAIAGRSMYNMDKAVPGSCLVLSCLVLSCLAQDDSLYETGEAGPTIQLNLYHQ